jgi:hypothetical protein
MDVVGRVQVQALAQLVGEATVAQAAEVGDVVHQLPAGQVLIQGQLAGQVADAAADLQAVGAAVHPQDLGPPAGGPDQVEQQPDGGRLAGAVGAEEPEHLARPHGQVQAGDPRLRP